ncbi:MAG: hypothetical protein M3Y87_30925, partial [Myxococcota bacterium]|nr:hypothetical protein [Myxococcota bacterium]
ACAEGAGSCLGGACCAGCWSGRVCEVGTAVAACGVGGDECEPCGGATPYCDSGCVGPRPVAELAIMAESACAVATDGTIWCWGANGSGQLGVGTLGADTESTMPVRVGADSDWQHAGGGDGHMCGIRADGTLWCWGDNMDGQLGSGDLTSRAVPVRVGDVGPWELVVGGNGGDHTCALRDDGSLWCMGQADYGQLGIGPSGDRTTPTQVLMGTTWIAVAAGHHFTCGIQTGGSLWCWGENTQGQLGNGTPSTTRIHVPEQVGADTDWTAITGGDSHACGVRAGGELYCWGSSVDAQLGIGSTTPQPLPTRVGTASTWAQVSAGLAHTCAIQSDGSLWCWGKNDAGQLGLDRTGADVSAPERVGTRTDWRQVQTGDAFTCAVRTGGSAYCMGANLLGQLGQGDRITRTTPTEVRVPRP